VNNDETKAQRYRERAEQLRTIASGTNDHNAKKSLLNIADDYERLARSLTSIPVREARGTPVERDKAGAATGAATVAKEHAE